jgi:hypothetical protein
MDNKFIAKQPIYIKCNKHASIEYINIDFKFLDEKAPERIAREFKDTYRQYKISIVISILIVLSILLFTALTIIRDELLFLYPVIFACIELIWSIKIAVNAKSKIYDLIIAGL